MLKTFQTNSASPTLPPTQQHPPTNTTKFKHSCSTYTKFHLNKFTIKTNEISVLSLPRKAYCYSSCDVAKTEKLFPTKKTKKKAPRDDKKYEIC
jgi:hypothetical protein